ncbi:MAG: cytochrome c maturation protein CcmE [Sphingomonadaceae bacterium]|nr:cytochrome c maturation protein CcmE [Sphingomonadaceae bacterium]
MKAKNQRLVLALVALAALTGASVLAMSALKDQASYFLSPGDIARNGVEQGRVVRLGGMVTKGSLKHAPDGVTIDFVVRDETSAVPVRFRGIPPDLFKEGSGVVAEGAFAGNTFVATNLLAKHDERYMPPKRSGNGHVTKTLKG